jgi:hypothetical protein
MPRGRRKEVRTVPGLKTSFWIDRELWQRSKVYALKAGIEFQDLIRRALTEFLDRKEGKKNGKR